MILKELSLKNPGMIQDFEALEILSDTTPSPRSLQSP